MRPVNKRVFKGSLCLPLVAMALSGSANADSARVIKPGERVAVHFTCRLPDGKVISSTDKSVAEDRSQPKAEVFLASPDDKAVSLPSGSELETLRNKPLRGVEEEIISRLADAVVGMEPGRKRSVKMAASKVPLKEGASHLLQMARVRRRPKELRVSLEEYKSMKGKVPVVGDDYTIDPAFPGKVTAVTEKEIVVHFSARAGETVETPFGKGVVRDMGDHYEYEIEARKGDLVRSGPLLGRITSVDDRLINIDYNNPFAGEDLTCDVTPEITAGEKKVATEQAEGKTAVIGEQQAKEAGKEAMFAAVNKAVADAAKTGATSVDVDLAKSPDSIGKGDLVKVNYTASFDDGEIFASNRESVADDGKLKKVSWFADTGPYAPEEILAGSRELMPGLGEAVIGMTAGEKKRVTLSPEQAFGPPDPSRVLHYPVTRTMPRVITMPADEYVKRFKSFPAVGKELDITPYFNARVTKVTDNSAELECLAEDGKKIEDEFGSAMIHVKGDEVSISLTPQIDSVVQTPNGRGRITSTDGETFTVDFNSPMAGKKIVLDLEVVSLAKAAALHTKPIVWLEDRASGLELAKKENKPVFLILYADWCQWCKKTFTETLPDPRIGELRDRFVWLKLNSDKEQKYKKEYGQNGFPMMVVLKPDGSVLKKIDGYRDARALKAELDGVI